jgi:phosphoribosyl 1,2-cyclic phosphodiesterase
MKVTLWGTRGSIATPGPDTSRYGGNTSCVEVRGADGTVLVLDAGTGIRPLGASLPAGLRRVDVFLTHLHLDHILGLGFFGPVFDPDMELHLWGPAQTPSGLHASLSRYLSPPLFPVHLSEVPCKLVLHDVPCGAVRVGEFTIESDFISHPGPTVGYRITSPSGTVAYMPDHEPALGGDLATVSPEWISGFQLLRDVDLLIHDSQYTEEEYPNHVGWGHSSIHHVITLAKRAGVKQLLPFHHDPSHTDVFLDSLFIPLNTPELRVIAAGEGTTITI